MPNYNAFLAYIKLYLNVVNKNEFQRGVKLLQLLWDSAYSKTARENFYMKY